MQVTNGRPIPTAEDFTPYGEGFGSMMDLIKDILEECAGMLSSTVDGDDLEMDAGTFSGALAVTGAITGSSTLTLTVANASALTVGPAGATNPTLKIHTSTTSAATGISITAAAAAGGVALAAISSGTNETMTIDAKGTGGVNIACTSTGDVLIGDATNPAFKVDHNAASAATGLAVTAAAAGSAVAVAVLSSGTNESLTIDAKGSGTVSLNATGTGAVVIGSSLRLYAKNVVLSTTTGTKIGTAATQKLGFFNATPVVQPSGASQGAATNTTTTTCTTTALQTDLDALRVQVNKMRTDLVALGLQKGSA